jgi:hypothetical protein
MPGRARVCYRRVTVPPLRGTGLTRGVRGR